MTELEVAILIVVCLLLLLSVVSIVLYWKRGSPGHDYSWVHNKSCKCRECFGGPQSPATSATFPGNYKSSMENFVGADMSQNVLGPSSGWNAETIAVGIDPATKLSHKEWTTDFLRRTTTSSPWSVTDHDISSNWLGLGTGKTWQRIHSMPGARVSEGVDWQDMPSTTSLRWRCHDYPTEVAERSCPWEPTSDQMYK
jgi:hypothetical protein